MPSTNEKTTDVDEVAQDPHPPPQPSMTVHVYSPTPSIIKVKRRQVKNACTNCRKACKKCDDARPCLRCVKYGTSETCVDSQRKPRPRGKRGPYKRKGKGGNVNQDTQEPIQKAPAGSAIQAEAPQAEDSSICAFCPPFGYPENFYNHFPPVAPQAECVGACTPVAQPYFFANFPDFHSYKSYIHPVHDPENRVHPPQGYYTYVFPSVSYHPGQ